MRITYFFVALLFYSVAYSAIPSEGWYAGLLVGATWASDFAFIVTNPFTNTPIDGWLSYEAFRNEGGQIGYRYGHFRFEGQLLFNKNNIKDIQFNESYINSYRHFNGLTVAGNTRFLAGIFNTYYEFYQEDREIRFVPYVGLGLGYTSIENTLNLRYANQSFYNKETSVSSPIGQGIIGVNYFVKDTCAMGLDFRYMSTPNHQTLNTRIAAKAIDFVINVTLA